MKNVVLLLLSAALIAPLAIAAPNHASPKPEDRIGVRVDEYPVITEPDQAESFTVYTTTSKTFAVVVTTPADPTDLPLLYQWCKDGVAITDDGRITDATTTTLSLTNILLADAGVYTCKVKTQHNLETTSLTYTLTVRKSLVFTKEPWTQTFYEASSIILFGEADGEGPITYHWELDGADISGATNKQFVKTNAQATDGGQYELVAQDAYGNVLYSDPATIKVRPVGTPYPEWKFTHVAGASTADLVINAHDLALQCQVVGTFPNSLTIGNVVRIGVIFRVGTTDHIVRVDAVLPTDGDSATLTINGSTAVDWTNKASPIDLITFSGQVLGMYILDTNPVLEKRANNGFVQFLKNGTLLTTNGQYYDW